MCNCGVLYFTANSELQEEFETSLKLYIQSITGSCRESDRSVGKGARCGPTCYVRIASLAGLGVLTMLKRSIDRFQCSPCVSNWIRYTLVELPNYPSA
jgi:hypothetical protein